MKEEKYVERLRYVKEIREIKDTLRKLPLNSTPERSNLEDRLRTLKQEYEEKFRSLPIEETRRILNMLNPFWVSFGEHEREAKD